jgi:acyl dehydratase
MAEILQKFCNRSRRACPRRNFDCPEAADQGVHAPVIAGSCVRARTLLAQRDSGGEKFGRKSCRRLQVRSDSMSKFLRPSAVHAPVVAGFCVRACVRARTLLAPFSEAPEERKFASNFDCPDQGVHAPVVAGSCVRARTLLVHLIVPKQERRACPRRCRFLCAS